MNATELMALPTKAARLAAMRELLTRSAVAVEEGLLAIYARQTADEQSAARTEH